MYWDESLSGISITGGPHLCYGTTAAKLMSSLSYRAKWLPHVSIRKDFSSFLHFFIGKKRKRTICFYMRKISNLVKSEEDLKRSPLKPTNVKTWHSQELFHLKRQEYQKFTVPRDGISHAKVQHLHYSSFIPCVQPLEVGRMQFIFL